MIQLSPDNGGVNADSDPRNAFDPLILLRVEKVKFWREHRAVDYRRRKTLKMQNWAAPGTYDLNDSYDFLTHNGNVFSRDDNKVIRYVNDSTQRSVYLAGV